MFSLQENTPTAFLEKQAAFIDDVDTTLPPEAVDPSRRDDNGIFEQRKDLNNNNNKQTLKAVEDKLYLPLSSMNMTHLVLSERTSLRNFFSRAAKIQREHVKREREKQKQNDYMLQDCIRLLKELDKSSQKLQKYEKQLDQPAPPEDKTQRLARKVARAATAVGNSVVDTIKCLNLLDTRYSQLSDDFARAQTLTAKTEMEMRENFARLIGRPAVVIQNSPPEYEFFSYEKKFILMFFLVEKNRMIRLKNQPPAGTGYTLDFTRAEEVVRNPITVYSQTEIQNKVFQAAIV